MGAHAKKQGYNSIISELNNNRRKKKFSHRTILFLSQNKIYA